MATENVKNTGHLTTPQRAALEALADGATKAQAATVANRTERTLRRWISEDAAFADAMKASTDETVADAGRRLAALLSTAVDVLEEILQGDISAHIRLRAVDIAIGNFIKLRELGDLAERVAALEERLQ